MSTYVLGMFLVLVKYPRMYIMLSLSNSLTMDFLTPVKSTHISKKGHECKDVNILSHEELFGRK